MRKRKRKRRLRGGGDQRKRSKRPKSPHRAAHTLLPEEGFLSLHIVCVRCCKTVFLFCIAMTMVCQPTTVKA